MLKILQNKNYYSTVNINFNGQPKNYAVIDKFVSRSAQPQKEDFEWLKRNGITDIINFRTEHRPNIDFDEESFVKAIGIRYHSIPSVTSKPKAENVQKFLTKIEKIKKSGGKIHIHCFAGADRTGMYAFIYKMINGIGTISENIAEWYQLGLHYNKYPHLVDWAKDFLKIK